jgi:hypothetical protein
MKYMLSFFAEEGGWDEVTPEEIKAGMEPWNELDREMTEAGIGICGEGLQPSSTATTVKVGEGDERMVTDGPYAETKEQLGGFMLLECDDLDEALGWANKVPLSKGSSIEVRPVMDYSQFA